MSDAEPVAPYVYQPFGMQNKDHWSSGRIYGVGHPNWMVTIKGLTKEEAEAVRAALAPAPVVPEGFKMVPVEFTITSPAPEPKPVPEPGVRALVATERPCKYGRMCLVQCPECAAAEFGDPKYCVHCGIHIDSLRPPEPEDNAP